MDPQGKSKAEVMRALMRHPGTAKMFRDAVNSPVGSTSRSKAQKVFKIVNKLQSSYDGAGGPGMNMERQEQPSGYPAPNYSSDAGVQGMVVFHKLPPMNISYNGIARAIKDRPKALDGAGGPSYAYDGEGGIGDWFSGALDTFQNAVGDFLGGQPAEAAAPNMSVAPTQNYNPVPNYSPTPSMSVAPAPNMSKMNYSPAPTPSMSAVPGANMSKANMSVAPKDLTSNPALNMSTEHGPVSTLGSIQLGPTVPQTTTTTSGEQSGGGPSNLSGSILSTNPSGIKYGASTKKWVDQGLATIGPAAKDGGNFLVFKTRDAGLAAEKDLLFNSGVYSNLTVDAALKKWSNSGYGGEIAPSLSGRLISSLTPAEQDQLVQAQLHAEGGDGGGSSSTSSPSSFGNLSSSAAGAVAANQGPLTFASQTMLDPNDPITHGKTMGQAESDNQKSIWAKYNIGGLQDEEVKLRTIGATLPTDITNYIKGRDQYLNQTDQMINNYISTAPTTMDMSDPVNQAAANSHLAYMYTLRGAQNSRYIDYMNSSIQQNKDDLQHVTDMYSTALNAYQIDLTSANNVTEDMYKTYSAALSDMYTTLDGAPTKALQTQYLQEQILGAHAQNVRDAATSTVQGDYLKDSAALNGHVTDNQGYVLPGIDLVNLVNQYGVLEPSMSPTSIITKYAEGVNNLLSARDGAKTVEGQLIDSKLKLAAGQDAIKQFAAFANQGMSAGNLNTYQLGISSAQDVARRIGNSIGGSLNQGTTATSLMDAIKALDPHAGLFSWFPHAPSKDEFTKTVTSKTGGAVDPAIISALYDSYKEYITPTKNPDGSQYAGGSPASFVQGMLYNMNDTASRANPQLYTPDQFAQNVGLIYAQSLLNSALGSQSSGSTPGSTLSM